MTAPQKGNVCGSQFFFNEDAKCLFVCYQPKTNKTVSLLSSMHTNTEICDGQKAKPEILNFYNKNKGEVDVFDQMSRKYSCHSASRRSPLAVWANILDISAINANVVFTKSMQRSMSRPNFSFS